MLATACMNNPLEVRRKETEYLSVHDVVNLQPILFPILVLARHTLCRQHATAIKTILRYLKKTWDKGTVVTPSDQFDLKMYVDADFAGLFGQENDRDSNSVRSRTGYTIKFANWPILAKSVLQTNLSQSTLEAEYTALSYALKTLLPLKWLLEEMINWLNGTSLRSTTILATVFEDNQSAFYLATNHRITNQTRYLLSKFHWFWSLYDEGDQFEIKKCTTDEQQADYLTKPLPKDEFVEIHLD